MTGFAGIGILIVAATSLSFLLFGGWRIPERFKDKDRLGDGSVYVGAAQVRSTWISTPLATLCVNDGSLQFRSRILFPRPIAFRRDDVTGISFDNDGWAAWTRMSVCLADGQGFRFRFSCRRTEALRRELERRGWPIVPPTPT